MYEIIENPRIMTREEIRNQYTGKWVYVVKANITQHGELIEGMPVVLGEYQFDGVDEGIYEQWDTPEYEERLSYMLIPAGNCIASVYGMVAD